MEESYFFLKDSNCTTNEFHNNVDKKLSGISNGEDAKSDSNNQHNQVSQPGELNQTLNTTIEELKKNLYNNEEEFRCINHSEPIHIFLKLKPLTQQELLKQNNQVQLNILII
jgi:hypothetical protein